jgi:hypothetical protein
MKFEFYSPNIKIIEFVGRVKDSSDIFFCLCHIAGCKKNTADSLPERPNN